jgi:ADP-ribosylglycohydrolase
MPNSLKEKIWGSFAGLAVGDAMGMPLHELTPGEIQKRNGGRVNTFLPIWDDEFIHLDYLPGQVTDDTTLSIITAKTIIKYKGNPTTDQFVKELGEWVKNNTKIWQHGLVYGPSTRVAFFKMIDGVMDYYKENERGWCYTGTSNGSVMRIAPAGWPFPGDVRKSVELACKMILPTHPTEIALSAGSAQAAAVSEALKENATVDSVLDAMLEGAKLGEEIGLKIARVVEQRNPYQNLEIALELAAKASDAFEAANNVRRLIGSHLHATEAISTAAAIFYASKGNTEEAILAGCNNGTDPDTIASISGALTGALNGIDSVPAEWVKTVATVNNLEFEDLASQMAEI